MLSTLNATGISLPVVILDFSTLRGINSQILPPKRYRVLPHRFSMGIPPPPSARLGLA